MTNSAIRTGCVLEIEKPYFSGSFKNAKFVGVQTMVIEVLKHSYGQKKGQHTFTCKVLEILEALDLPSAHKVGEKFRIKGRNLYPNVQNHKQGQESIAANYR
ncbi:hypothetical protein CMK18_22305 [Candidatus Poribacteria bacterium]|nr:hypothetical protein [Candidatus Poribacteria bacterium]|tara:strand:- start:14 stop:319 length:306 start_codon:yes stop_codon:yes gene_type:complete